LNSRITLVHYL